MTNTKKDLRRSYRIDQLEKLNPREFYLLRAIIEERIETLKTIEYKKLEKEIISMSIYTEKSDIMKMRRFKSLQQDLLSSLPKRMQKTYSAMLQLQQKQSIGTINIGGNTSFLFLKTE